MVPSGHSTRKAENTEKLPLEIGDHSAWPSLGRKNADIRYSQNEEFQHDTQTWYKRLRMHGD